MIDPLAPTNMMAMSRCNQDSTPPPAPPPHTHTSTQPPQRRHGRASGVGAGAARPGQPGVPRRAHPALLPRRLRLGRRLHRRRPALRHRCVCSCVGVCAILFLVADSHRCVVVERNKVSPPPHTPTRTHAHPRAVKVRLQTSSYRGPVDCLRQLLAKEGAHALFKGMSSPVLTASVVNAVVFSSYNEAMAVRACVLLLLRWNESMIGMHAPPLSWPSLTHHHTRPPNSS